MQINLPIFKEMDCTTLITLYRILSNTDYKEFLWDLIINEEFINYKLERNEYSDQPINPLKNMCMKSDWSEEEDLSSDAINMIKQKAKPNTRGSSRRFGQHLHPIFFHNQRGILIILFIKYSTNKCNKIREKILNWLLDPMCYSQKYANLIIVHLLKI